MVLVELVHPTLCSTKYYRVYFNQFNRGAVSAQAVSEIPMHRMDNPVYGASVPVCQDVTKRQATRTPHRHWFDFECITCEPNHGGARVRVVPVRGSCYITVYPIGKLHDTGATGSVVACLNVVGDHGVQREEIYDVSRLRWHRLAFRLVLYSARGILINGSPSTE